MNEEMNSAFMNMSRRRALKPLAADSAPWRSGACCRRTPRVSRAFTIQPRAKRVIYLFQSGGPSQIDLFDHKPALKKFHGTDIFAHVEKAGRLTGFTNGHKIHPVITTQYKFKQHGGSGSWTSELLPDMSRIVDDVCTIRSASTTPVNHDPAMTFMQTGHNLPGRPSMGSWLSYGLGSMNRNLPDFAVLVSTGDLPNMQPLNSRLWGNGFLPGRYQGVRLRPGAEPVLYLSDPNRQEPGANGGDTRHHPPTQRRAVRKNRRSGDRHTHRAVRDGLPHANLDSRVGGSIG